MKSNPEPDPTSLPPGAGRPLGHLLQQAAAELAAQPAPPLAPAVLAALPPPGTDRSGRVFPPSQAKAPRRSGGWGWLTGSLAGAGGAGTRRWSTVAAAFGVMLVSVTVLLLVGPGGGGDVGGLRAGTAPGFVAVASQERWSRLQDDGGAAWVVTTELPQARLAGYGLPYDPARAADTVRAELLMRASGEVLAVRVLY